MKAKRKSTKTGALEVRQICGYVAICSTEPENATHGWLYLRRHSETELFIGNIPRPDWLSTEALSTPEAGNKLQKRFKQLIHHMVPGATTVGDAFGTANGRVATRVAMKDGAVGVQELLDAPADHLYLDWGMLRGARTDGVVEGWLRTHEEARDEGRVRAWADAAMRAYEGAERRREAERARKAKEGAVPDGDGFVTVTTGAKRMMAAEAQALHAKGRVGRGHYKSKSGRNRKSLLDVGKGIEKSGFYRWQRENKNVLVDLQKKFKEDQKRVAAIRGLEKGE